MTANEPRYIYREEILRWAWWLHTILVVVWGLNVVVGGWVENGTVELREKKLGLSVVGQCEASRKIEASVHLAVTLFGFFFLFTFQLLRYQIYLEVRSSSGQQQHSSMMITASIVPRAELVLFPRIHQHTSQ